MRSVSVLRGDEGTGSNHRVASHQSRSAFHTGFTLIELLVVIAIIAILMVVTMIVLNPGQLLAQSRDSNRLSDMSSLKAALALYTTDVVTSTPLGTKFSMYSYLVSSAPTWFTGIATYVTATTTTSGRKIDGTGWIPVNFNSISSGAPFAQLPVDPVNTVTGNMLYYSYAASGTALFKLAAKMESTKFGYGGTSDAVSADGGYDTSTYEAGPGITVL
jgi:prepilin-type N-terminal cleavage/methylation domain-containing protein